MLFIQEAGFTVELDQIGGACADDLTRRIEAECLRASQTSRLGYMCISQEWRGRVWLIEYWADGDVIRLWSIHPDPCLVTIRTLPGSRRPCLFCACEPRSSSRHIAVPPLGISPVFAGLWFNDVDNDQEPES